MKSAIILSELKDLQGKFRDESDLMDLFNKALRLGSDSDQLSCYLQELTHNLAANLHIEAAKRVLSLLCDMDDAFDDERSISLYDVALMSWKVGRKGEALDYLERSHQSAKNIYRCDQRAEVINEIANIYWLFGEQIRSNEVRFEAILVAKEGENIENEQESVESSSVLIGISRDILRFGNKDWAYSVAKSIKNINKQKRALSLILKNE